MIFNSRMFSTTVCLCLETGQREVWKTVTWRKNNVFKQTTKSLSCCPGSINMTWLEKETPEEPLTLRSLWEISIHRGLYTLESKQSQMLSFFFSCRIKPSQKPETWFVLWSVVPVVFRYVTILNRGKVSLLWLLPAVLISTRWAIRVTYSLSLQNKSCLFRIVRWKAGVPSYGL